MDPATGLPVAGIPGVGVPVAGGLQVVAAGDPFGLADDQAEAWFYDDQVKPGHTYRYQARIEVVNSLLHLPKPLKVAPPAGLNQLSLASKNWTTFKEVTIEADEYFFLTANGLAGKSKDAFFDIYKWYQGGWVTVQDRVEIGSILGGMKKVRLANHKTIDVDFGATYTVVDIQAISGSGGDNMQVVLQNNLTGQLVQHNMLTDVADPQHKNLIERIQQKPGTP